MQVKIYKTNPETNKKTKTKNKKKRLQNQNNRKLICIQ